MDAESLGPMLLSFLMPSREVDGCNTNGLDVGVIMAPPSGLKLTGARKTALPAVRPTPGGTGGPSDSEDGTKGNFMARNSGILPSSEPGQIISLITSQYDPLDLFRPGSLDAREHYRHQIVTVNVKSVFYLYLISVI